MDIYSHVMLDLARESADRTGALLLTWKARRPRPQLQPRKPPTSATKSPRSDGRAEVLEILTPALPGRHDRVSGRVTVVP
jgi:hypothetical protein